ncbi:hypothetical protein DV738_g2504, partial [Chaetothyriales sp. CBS 135597]
MASTTASPVPATLPGRVGPYKEFADTNVNRDNELKGTDKFAAATYPHYLPVWDNEKGVLYPPLEPFEHVEHGKDADPSFPNLLKSGTTIEELTPSIGAEVTGVQLLELSDKGKDELALLVAQKKVVAFRDQNFADVPIDQALDFARYFGRLHIHPTSGAPEGYPEVHLVHRGADDKGFGGLLETRTNSVAWHSDVTYENQPPGTTFLYALDVPPSGGDTIFVNQVKAYERLSPAFRERLAGLKAVHSGFEQATAAQNRGGTVRRAPVSSIHPLVRTHPATGEKALYINPQFTRYIVGFKQEESDAILQFLYNHIALSQDLQARVRWRPRTVVVWDNRVTAHSALFDWEDGARRHIARITPQAERFLSTGLFVLGRSLPSQSLYGLVASVAFGFGAVFTICGVGTRSHDMDGPVVFSAVSTSVRQLQVLLRCIAFGPKAEVQITSTGIRFSVDEARVVQGATFIEKSLFSSYDFNPEDGSAALPPFEISISAFLDTLQILGISDLTPARNQIGGFASSYNNAFSTPSLGLAGTCRISYAQVGAPLCITIQEGTVTTTCQLNTYGIPGGYEETAIPLDRQAICLKIIMRSTWLHDAINELAGTHPTSVILNASERSAPFFALEGKGGPFGDAIVDYLPESKTEPTPSLSRSKKRPLVTETFSVPAPPGSHGRVKQRYKFDLIKKADKAMALASKVSIRQDQQGVLSLQFMVELSGPGASSAEKEGTLGGAGSAADKAYFIDFSFLPLLDEDSDCEGSEGDDFL